MKWTKYSFLICWLISLLSFIPSFGSGFVHDFVGWQRAYAKGTFIDIFTSFGYHGNHQFLHFIFYNFYQLFHLQSLPWYLLFCTLHAVNGFLLYKVILLLGKTWSVEISPLLAFCGAVLFLVQPYNVEAVVAKVCVHYLMSMLLIFSIIFLFIRYIDHPSIKVLLAGGLLYVLSLFSLEISFVTPLMISLLGLMTVVISRSDRGSMKRVGLFSGMMWLLFAGYLLFNKATLGSLVGHYGSDVHLKFDLLGMVATEIKYLIKHLFYARFYSYNAKVFLFDKIISLPEIAFFSLTVLLGVGILYFIRIKKISSPWHLAFYGLAAMMIYTLSVANIYFTHLHVGLNDRYSYVPLAFFYIMIIALLVKVPGRMKYPIVGILFALNLFFQQKILQYWNISTDILTSLKQDFRWNDAPYVFIMNSPDNYKGIVMTSIIGEPTGIDELIDNQTPRPFNGVMYDIFQFNMATPTDGVKVEQTGPMQLKVTFNQWGNWWHRNGIGAGNYENEFYKTELLDHPYMVTFKQFPPGSVIIYQVGDKWEEFKLITSN